MNEQDEFIRRIPPQVEWAILILPDGVGDFKAITLRCPTYGFVAEKCYQSADRIIDKKLAIRTA